MLTNRTALLVAGTVSLGLMGVAAFATADAPPEQAFHVYEREIATKATPEQTKAFPIFARERSSADVLPKSAREMVGNSRQSGRNIDLSRAIDTPTGRGWAFPGTNTICVAAPDPVDGYGITCVDTAFAAKRGVVLLMGRDGDPSVNVTWLTPRGARASSTDSQGRTTPLDIAGNGVASARLQNAKRLELVTADGTSTPMTVPPFSQTGPSYVDCGDGPVPAEQAAC